MSLLVSKIFIKFKNTTNFLYPKTIRGPIERYPKLLLKFTQLNKDLNVYFFALLEYYLFSLLNLIIELTLISKG